MSSALLPSNVGYYTRAITDANDTHGRYAAQLDDIKLIGRTKVPADWLPWLVRDAGLERLMPFVDWATLLEKGPAWLRIRGTPAATVEALGWVGWHVRFECGPAGTDLYDHYHVHLPTVPSLEEIERIVGIERVAKSTDSTFFRLVHGYDVRPVRGAMTRLAGARFARHSGVDLRPDWPRLSFRLQPVLHVNANARAIAAETLRIDTRAVRRGHVVLGRSRRPQRPTPGPVWGLQLSDSVMGRQLARVRAGSRFLPVAGLRGAVSIRGSRQALHVAMRKIAGETPRHGAARNAGVFTRPRTIQLMRVPDPISASAFAVVNPQLLIAAESFPVAATVGPLNLTAHAQLVGLMAEGAVTDLGNAPWSGLPWAGEWGEAPRAFAIEKQVETD